MQHLASFLGAGAAFLALDLLWLGVIASNHYRSQMGPLLAEQFNIPAATAFYVIYLVGVVVFAVAPALADGALLQAAGRGALFGFFCYATYDLTALAVIRGFPQRLAILDIAWGTVLTACAAAAGFAAARLAAGV
ncbi:MAG: DUF2177 family protein [Hyphococcus sp.]